MKLAQLHLRDLFWLVLVCGLALGWWLERIQSREQGNMWREHAAYWQERAERFLVECIKNDPTIPLEGRRFSNVPPKP